MRNECAPFTAANGAFITRALIEQWLHIKIVNLARLRLQALWNQCFYERRGHDFQWAATTAICMIAHSRSNPATLARSGRAAGTSRPRYTRCTVDWRIQCAVGIDDPGQAELASAHRQETPRGRKP